LEFIKKKFVFEIQELDDFKMKFISGPLSAQLRFQVQHVVNYVIEQLQYGNTVVLSNGKIALDVNFQKFAKRVEKYYYHRCFIYLLISIDATRTETTRYLHGVLSQNYPTCLNEFFEFYNEKIGFTYEISSRQYFSAAMLADIFYDSIIILSKFYPFNIVEFGLKLKSIIDSFSEIKLNELIYRSSFRKSLEDFFVKQFDINFMALIEIVRNIDFNKMSNAQIRNSATHLFLKELHKWLLENNKKFNGSCLSNVVNIGQIFCSFLLYSIKKYRVFFSLKGIESEVNKIDLGKVKIYDEKWNFYESESFVRDFTEKIEPLDKFKRKLCCDVEFNNEYDALVNAKQICFDALSNVSLIYAYSREKKFRPYFETYYDITEIPQKKHHMSRHFLWPTQLENER
jgi:hypothetical protein